MDVAEGICADLQSGRVQREGEEIKACATGKGGRESLGIGFSVDAWWLGAAPVIATAVTAAIDEAFPNNN